VDVLDTLRQALADRYAIELNSGRAGWRRSTWRTIRGTIAAGPTVLPTVPIKGTI